MKKLYNTRAKVFLSSVMLLCAAWSARAQFPDPYCEAAFPDGVEPITRVQFAGIDKTSPAATSSPEMEDFTAISGTVTPTMTYPITIKGNTAGFFYTNYLSVFIDWNQDGEFTEDEGYNIGTITGSTGTDAVFVSGTIAVPFSAVAGDTRMRVVKRYSDYGLPCNDDDYGQTEDYTITVTAAPACVSPSDVALASEPTVNGASLTWMPQGTPPSGGYEYYYSTSSTAPTEATLGTDVATTSVTLGSLPSNTTHYFWVRSDCGGTYSSWAPFTFTTACDAVAAPFLQTFSSGTLPSCWTNESTYNAGTALWFFSGAVGYAQGNTRPDGTFAWVDGSDPSGGINDVTLTTPPISISGLTTPQLVFDYFSNNAGEYENNILTVEVYDGNNWNNVFTDNTSLATWRTITIPLTGYTGTIQVRFIVDKTAAPDEYAFYNDILLDNVAVQETPACAVPTGLLASGVTHEEFTVEWAESSSSPSEYEYELRTSGDAGSGVAGLIISGTTTGLTQTFSDLEDDTDFTFYVRSNCGSVYSDWVSLEVSTVPSPPANDECTGAIALTVNTDFACTSKTAGTTVSATLSMDATPCYGNPDDDVWFSFVATNESHSVSLSNIVAVTGGSTDMNIQVLSGTCDATESILCSDPESTLATGLTPGETYYVRIYSWYTSRNTFDLCIGTPPAAPANDDCAGAVALTVNPDYSCAATMAGTTAGATESMEADPCGGNPDDDVWYSFVATGESHNIRLSGITAVSGTSTDLYMQVLSGTCDAMESLKCSDPENTSVTDLVPGETYYVRVYSYGNSLNNFTICVGTPPEAPANDECEGAVEVTVNAGVDCAAVVAGTTASATETMEAGECGGNPDDDVWYWFTATAEQHTLSLTGIVAVEGGGTDLYMQVLSGACGTMDSVLCSDNESAIAEDLVPGEIYYVRVYSYGTDARHNFNFCVGTIPPPPANDECTDAVTLTAGGTFDANDITGTIAGATDSTDATGAPEADCNGYEGGDVWFTVAVPASGELTIETLGIPGNALLDTVLEAYEGDCGGLTLITCNDDDGTDAFSIINLEDRTAGEIIYVRAWEYNNDVLGSFRISAYDGSLGNADFTADSFKAYPNPVKDVLTISHTSDITSVAVYNMLGQQVLSKEVNAAEAVINMSSLADGAYIVNVTAGDTGKTIKVVKQQ